MKSNDFYEDLRYCSTCRRDVQYLRAWEKSYCVECQSVVSTRSERRPRPAAAEGADRRARHDWWAKAPAGSSGTEPGSLQRPA